MMTADVIEMRRGRPLSSVPADAVEAEMEEMSREMELSLAANVLPLARYVQQYVAADGVGLVTSAQGRVVDFLEAQSRRHPPDNAA